MSNFQEVLPTKEFLRTNKSPKMAFYGHMMRTRDSLEKQVAQKTGEAGDSSIDVGQLTSVNGWD